MAKKRTRSGEIDQTAELLRDLIIIQLGLAGVAQKEIRNIVGVDMNRINRICKILPPKSK